MATINEVKQGILDRMLDYSPDEWLTAAQAIRTLVEAETLVDEWGLDFAMVQTDDDAEQIG